MFTCKQKINLIPQCFLEILQFKESRTFWFIPSEQELCQIWKLQWESQELKELSFSIVYRETSNKNIEKNAKYPIF